jgi:HEAT repeat protein
MSSTRGRVTLSFFACALALSACDRPYRTMGRYIEAAGLIVIADVGHGISDLSVTLTVTEFLKGNAPRSITIARQSCPRVPDGKGTAVLLSPDWRSSEFPVIEVYTEPAAIARLRELVPIYRMTERQRLYALRSDPKYRDQLFDDIHEMRERDNYPIVTDLYPNLDQAGRLKLIELIGYIGDARGVPALLQALKSDAAPIREAARTVLAFHFPDSAPAAALAPPPAVESPMQKGFRLAKEGRIAEARPLLMAVAVDRHESEQIRLWAALELIPHLDVPAKNALRQSMLPLLAHIVKDGDYLQVTDAVKILRQLRHPGNLDLLVSAIGRKDYLQQESSFQAAMALRELDAAERTRAVAMLTRILQDREKAQGYRTVGGPPSAPALALAWLNGDVARPSGSLPEGRPGGSRYDDEVASLIGVLGKPGDLPADSIAWIAMRLGELKDRRAIDPLTGLLANPQWPVAEKSKEALIRIGGDNVSAAMRRLLARGGPSAAREAALDVLCAVQGAGALPQIRAALAEKSLRTTALSLLARVGTRDDLTVLIPMSDFWTGDRDHHYWAMQAVGEIRSRSR